MNTPPEPITVTVERLRPWRRLKAFCVAVLVLGLVAGANLLSSRWYLRLDLGGAQAWELSAETLGMVEALPVPVHLQVGLGPSEGGWSEAVLERYVQNLVRAYAEASRGGDSAPITYGFVDLLRERDAAEDWRLRHGSIAPNSIRLIAGERERVLTPQDLVISQRGRIQAYTGERALTQALLETIAPTDAVAYVVTGHGEMRLDDPSPERGLSAFRRRLEALQFTVRALDLTQVEAVPEDARAVFILDPRGPVLPSERVKLQRYLERAGALVLALSPGVETGLDALLAPWGLYAAEGVVLETAQAYVERNGGVLVRRFAPHALTQPLIDSETVLRSSLLRPVALLPEAAGLWLEQAILMASSPESWREASTTHMAEAAYDPALDEVGPIAVAAVAQRRATTDLGLDVGGGRVLLLGMGDLWSNRYMDAFGNELFLSALSPWLRGQEARLQLPPRPAQAYQLQMSETGFQRLSLALVSIPCGLLVIGLVVFWWRRR